VRSVPYTQVKCFTPCAPSSILFFRFSQPFCTQQIFERTAVHISWALKARQDALWNDRYCGRFAVFCGGKAVMTITLKAELPRTAEPNLQWNCVT